MNNTAGFKKNIKCAEFMIHAHSAGLVTHFDVRVSSAEGVVGEIHLRGEDAVLIYKTISYISAKRLSSTKEIKDKSRLVVSQLAKKYRMKEERGE